MSRFAALSCGLALLLLEVPLAFAQESPSVDRIDYLISRLGSRDQSERASATKELEDLSPATIVAIRKAVSSADPDIAKAAASLLQKAEADLLIEKHIQPTFVELEAKNELLDAVLERLSKASGYEVVVGGLHPEQIVDRKVTVSTGGKVPFWNAVLKVCSAADLEIGGVAGSYAPGALTLTWLKTRGGLDLNSPNLPLPTSASKFRKASAERAAVVLVDRGRNAKRPTSVSGAMLVEICPLPAKADAPEKPAVLLQVWPEPKVSWLFFTDVSATRASGPSGAAIEIADQPKPNPRVQNVWETLMVRNRSGNLLEVRDVTKAITMVPGVLPPSTTRIGICFDPAGASPERLSELKITLTAALWSDPEEIVRVDATERGLPKNTRAALLADIRKGTDGNFLADVAVRISREVFAPAGEINRWTGIKVPGPSADGIGIGGLRVTDAAGIPYQLRELQGKKGDAQDQRITYELTPTRDGQGAPKTIGFWASYRTLVSVPVSLTNIPLAIKGHAQP